ncbi:MAG TPA: DUF6387 family protein [Thiopseudomonas sp.]|nr:DUF6387 family protein [Thiopseudomonas sp.]
MAKINRAEDLPDWFNLANYSACDKFGAAQWLEQLQRRSNLLEGHPDHMLRDNDDSDNFWFDFWLAIWRDKVTEVAEEVRRAPIFSPSKGEIIEWMADASNRPIKPVCPLDFVLQSDRDLDAERCGKAAIGISKRWEATNASSVTCHAFLKQARAPLSLNYYAGAPEIPIIQVDLGVSDAALKAAFASWLKEARSNQETGTANRGKSLYDRWARYGLLPYLDLKIWAMETESHVPDRVMSAAISKYDSGEANLRKTVVPIAHSLMEDLKELAALASAEIASSAPEKPEAF